MVERDGARARATGDCRRAVPSSELDADVGSKVEVVMRSLTIYDRIKTMFIARNVSLGARKAEKTKASGKAAAEEETAVEEEVAAPEPVAA